MNVVSNTGIRRHILNLFLKVFYKINNFSSIIHLPLSAMTVCLIFYFFQLLINKKYAHGVQISRLGILLKFEKCIILFCFKATFSPTAKFLTLI